MIDTVMETAPSNRNAPALAFMLLVIPLLPVAADTGGNLVGLDAKIVQLSKPGTTLEDVLALLGEPEKYSWGDETFQKNKLPQRFVASYRKDLDVFILRGTVCELRAERPGPGFT